MEISMTYNLIFQVLMYVPTNTPSVRSGAASNDGSHKVSWKLNG